VYKTDRGLSQHMTRIHGEQPSTVGKQIDLTEDHVDLTAKEEPKAKKQKMEKPPPPEKRQGRIKGFTASVRERLARAKQQRMFLISRETITPRHSKFFRVGECRKCV